jgi:hypothetical protein
VRDGGLSLGHMSPPLPDLGPPIAALALEDGTPVYDSEGERVGVVEEVLWAGAVGDIFEGVIIHTHPLPGTHLYADEDQISELHERGVLLAIPRRFLHPLRDLGRRRIRPGSPAFRFERWVRRWWDRLTGRR